MSERIDIDINVNMNNLAEFDELSSKINSATAEAEQLTDTLSNTELNSENVEADVIAEELSEATAEVERLEDALAEAALNGDDIQADIIADELAEATAKAESLQNQLEEISNTPVEPEFNIDTAGVDELQSRLADVSSEAEELTGVLSDIELGLSSADFDEISSALSDAEAEAEALQEKLDEIGSTTVNPEVDVKDNVEEVNEKLQETESTASNLTTALGGIAGVVGMDAMIETADNINMSWNRLKLTFGDNEKVVKSLESSTTAAASATGRSGSQVRDYFNQMGIAGIRNTELLQSSFESLSGKAIQTNSSIEAMQGYMQRMVMTGNVSDRMLRNLGLTTDDLGAAMGVTGEEAKKTFEQLDPQGRLEVLTKAMGDGKEANEMYKNSYAGLKQQAETAMAGLMGAVGQGVLPVITPMIQGATGFVKGFTNAFKSLPGPVQGAVGAMGGFLAIGATAIGTLGLLGQVGSGVVNGLRSMKSGYDTVRGAMGTAKAMMDALRNSESITQGVRAALAIATGAEATAEGGATAAKAAAIGPTTGLAIAENSLLWPLLLLVGAIVAVVAVMWYLYNTNSQVKAAVDGLAKAFTKIGQVIYGTVVVAVNWVIGALKNLWNYVMTLGGLLPENASITGNQIIDTVLKVIMFINTLPAQLAMIFINMIAQTLGFGNNFVQNMMSGAVRAVTGFVNNLVNLPARANTILLAVIARVASWAVSFVQRGVQAAHNFVNSVRNTVSGITSAITSALSGVVNAISQPFVNAWNKVKPYIDMIKQGIDTINPFTGFEGYSSFESYGGLDTTLNGTISNIQENSSNVNHLTVNNNFNGLVEESAADYIVDAVNDRLRREKLLKGV